MDDEQQHLSPQNLEQGITSEVVIEYLRDQRADRRWKNIRRFFVSAVILLSVAAYASTLAGSLGYRMLPTQSAAAAVPIRGVIATHAEASADSVITVLDRLFETETVDGIVLLIDSGGTDNSLSRRRQNPHREKGRCGVRWYVRVSGLHDCSARRQDLRR